VFARDRRLRARAGQQRVSGAWGKTQEAAALFALHAAAGPAAPPLEEAGLFWLEPGPLEAAFGLPPGSLPPMGASPDALLRHGGANRAPGRPAPAAAAARARAAGAAEGAAGAEVVPVAAAPGLTAAAGRCGGADAGGAATAGAGPAPAGAAGGAAAADAGGGVLLHGAGEVLEPVEVKSVCPFRLRTRRSRKGHRTSVYGVADRGPMQQARAPARAAPMSVCKTRALMGCALSR